MNMNWSICRIYAFYQCQLWYLAKICVIDLMYSITLHRYYKMHSYIVLYFTVLYRIVLIECNADKNSKIYRIYAFHLTNFVVRQKCMIHIMHWLVENVIRIHCIVIRLYCFIVLSSIVLYRESAILTTKMVFAEFMLFITVTINMRDMSLPCLHNSDSKEIE